MKFWRGEISALVITVFCVGNMVYAKDDDYDPASGHFITSVTERTFHEEVIDSLTPVVMDVCEDCRSRVDSTEKLAIHFSGKAKFFQLPINQNSTLKQRLEAKKIALPVYVVAIGEHLFPGRNNMTELEVRAFIESILSSNL